LYLSSRQGDEQTRRVQIQYSSSAQKSAHSRPLSKEIRHRRHPTLSFSRTRLSPYTEGAWECPSPPSLSEEKEGERAAERGRGPTLMEIPTAIREIAFKVPPPRGTPCGNPPGGRKTPPADSPRPTADQARELFPIFLRG